MGIDNIWIVILAVSTPIAGVVGFAIQLRNVRKLRLENDKLNLEIAGLIREQKASENRIVSVSNDEVIKYAHQNNRIKYSKAGKSKSISTFEKESFSLDWGEMLILFAAIFFIGYFLYDLFRFGKWLLSMF